MDPILSYFFMKLMYPSDSFSTLVQWGPISCNASYSATNISSCALLNVPVNIDPTVVTITSGDLNCSGFSFCLQRYLGVCQLVVCTKSHFLWLDVVIIVHSRRSLILLDGLSALTFTTSQHFNLLQVFTSFFVSYIEYDFCYC